MPFAPAVARVFRQRLGWDTLGYIIGSGLIVAAGIALFRLLHDVDHAKVADAMRATPPEAIVIAFLLIAASYFTLTFYDWFALRTIGHVHIPYRNAAFVGFLAYTIGHNIGATVFSAGLVRLRMYRAWGLDLIAIAKIAFLTGLTFWLGNAVVLGIGLIYAPEVASGINQLPIWANRGLAVIALAVIAGYLLWLLPRARVLGRDGWQVTLPSSQLTLIQIGIGVADLGLSALAMYVLIAVHAPVDLVSALVAYVLGALLGFASHAPGNLGVFEAAMLLALPQIEKEQLLASLLIFRCLYFLIPFTIAVAAFGMREAWVTLRRDSCS
jgi:glycosyltransferase 2 family protein